MFGLRELVGVGVLVLVAGLVGSLVMVRRHRFAVSIRAALADPDPSKRLAAIEILTRQGAERFLATLLWHSRVETDPAAREALARAIGPEDDVLLAAESDFQERRRVARHYIRTQLHRRI